jgi:hypothetical protein
MIFIACGSMFLTIGISQNNPGFSIAAALMYAAGILAILTDRNTGEDE